LSAPALSLEEEAAAEVRQVIKCLQGATPEDFDLHSAQLELALDEKREAMGAHATRLEWEAKDALRQVRSRLRDEAVASVRQAIARMTAVVNANSFKAVREEVLRRQSAMSEWLGAEFEAIEQEVKAAAHSAQMRIEQLSIMEVRRRIKAMSKATPENFEQLKEELDKAVVEHSSNIGAECDKVKEEARQGVEAGQRHSTVIAEDRAAKAREAEEAAARTAELTAEIGRIESEAGSATQAVGIAAEQEDLLSPEEALQAGKLCEEALVAVKTALHAAQEKCGKMSLDAAAQTLTFGEEPKESGMQVLVRGLLARLAATSVALDAALERAKAARERASRKATAARREREQREMFARFDEDGDETLCRAEVEALGKAEYEVDLKDDFFEKLRTALNTDAVVYDKFPRLRQMLAIERSEVRARAQRAAEEERVRREKEEAERRKREIAEREAFASRLLREAGDVLPDAAAALTRVEVDSADLLVGENLTSDQWMEAAASTESNMAGPSTDLATVRSKLESAIEALGEDLLERAASEISDLRIRLERAEARGTRLRLAVTKARERAKDAAEKEERLNKQRAKFRKLEQAYQEQEQDDDPDFDF